MWGGDDGFATKMEKRIAWYQHRDALLPGYTECRRPAAWWEFDAPEPRRVIGRTDYGMELLEDDEDYLHRLGLLSERERAVKKAWDEVRARGGRE